MALTHCTECNHQVSDKAANCPKCGNPIMAQTIEATGKKWKALQIFGVGLTLIAFTSCFALAGVDRPDDAQTLGMMSAWCLLIGVPCWIGGRLGAYWHHG